jgi:hypothetical protein
LWVVVLLALAVWQGWMILTQFDPERPWEALLDDRPVLSGCHPLHLYHGTLGARALHERGTLACYDPAFYAGYPKTPVFDSGSRPAELVLALAALFTPTRPESDERPASLDPYYNPRAYKVGLALLGVLAPWLLWTTARGVGLVRAAACLAVVLGLLAWWSQPCRQALEAGDVDLLLATLLVLAQSGLLLRYHRDPSPFGLLGLTVATFLGWFAHPLLMVLLLPGFLIFYVSVGTRHGLAWHAGLLGALAAAIGANGFWLPDWIDNWWIRVPLQVEGPLVAHRTFHTLWDAPLWGGPTDRALVCFLVGTALIGCVWLNQTGCRPAARLLGFGLAGFLFLAMAGVGWEPFARFGAARLVVSALLFAAVPAAQALAGTLGVLRRRVGAGGAVLLLGTSGLALGWGVGPGGWTAWQDRLRCAAPLALGLDEERTALVDALRLHTTAEARILWEDRPATRRTSRWTALLPLLTGRAFFGGLDPDAGIEHATMGLNDQTLAGRPLREWTAPELHDYCQRYNVGWVVCWSAAARERFSSWPEAARVIDLQDGETGCLFALQRQPSFALVGSARWIRADAHGILLGDVVPHEGCVLLSLHYQSGLQVSPSQVRLEREVDPRDPIPLVRLRLTEPASRVLVTWEKR